MHACIHPFHILKNRKECFFGCKVALLTDRGSGETLQRESKQSHIHPFYFFSCSFSSAVEGEVGGRRGEGDGEEEGEDVVVVDEGGGGGKVVRSHEEVDSTFFS